MVEIGFLGQEPELLFRIRKVAVPVTERKTIPRSRSVILSLAQYSPLNTFSRANVVVSEAGPRRNIYYPHLRVGIEPALEPLQRCGQSLRVACGEAYIVEIRVFVASHPDEQRIKLRPRVRRRLFGLLLLESGSIVRAAWSPRPCRPFPWRCEPARRRPTQPCVGPRRPSARRLGDLPPSSFVSAQNKLAAGAGTGPQAEHGTPPAHAAARNLEARHILCAFLPSRAARIPFAGAPAAFRTPVGGAPSSKAAGNSRGRPSGVGGLSRPGVWALSEA